ncbi:hypothetical protein ScPMuIL_017881 [Solemya velum]
MNKETPDRGFIFTTPKLNPRYSFSSFTDGIAIVLGSWSSQQANAVSGQLVTSFCFHGEGIIHYTLNTTGNSDIWVYLFLNDDWKDVAYDSNCYAKLQKARATYKISQLKGNISVPVFKYPRIWDIVYADSLTCDDDAFRVADLHNFIAYNLTLFNPDALGNPIEHFSDEETGLLRFYQLLTLTYFVLACIFVPRLWETLSSGGPMQLVIQLLTASTVLQALSTFVFMVHLQRYSYNGVGSGICQWLSEFTDVLSQFCMLSMLLFLSLGWTLATSPKMSYMKYISDKPAAKVVAGLGVLQGLLFIWEQYEERDRQIYHAQRSYSRIILVSLRIVLASVFGWNLYSVVSAQRSAMKRDFYTSFTKSCLLWFLSYPNTVILSWMFSEYLRYKLVTMGVVLCQCVAVVLLYRLFLSRSLYWEVSALSSSLPIHFNKHFKIKVYS